LLSRQTRSEAIRPPHQTGRRRREGSFQRKTESRLLGKGSALDIRFLKRLKPQSNKHKILVTLLITVYPSEAAATDPLVVP
jgi:hypothetical protein